MSIDSLRPEDWVDIKRLVDQEVKNTPLETQYSSVDMKILIGLKEPERTVMRSSLDLIEIKKSFEIQYKDLPTRISYGSPLSRALCRFRLTRGF